MNKIFIIAGNHQQFLNYVRDKGNRSSFIYVSDATMLIGYHQPHGVFIGTWYEREDIEYLMGRLQIVGSLSLKKVLKMIDIVEEKSLVTR